MPTYDYTCDACRHQFEEIQPITAPPLTDCPSCGQPRLRRLFGGGGGIIFKGSGFYETDYRRKEWKTSNDHGPARPAGDAPTADNAAASGNPASDSSARTVASS